MLTDVIVDTNVWVHAGNPSIEWYEFAQRFCESVLVSSVVLAIDEGFSIDESMNTSLIGGEYLEHLRAGSLGYTVVATMAATGRIAQISTRVDNATRKRIERLIANKRDRTFIRVATRSTDRTIVSHDFKDFSSATRSELRRRLDVIVIDSDEGCTRVTG